MFLNDLLIGKLNLDNFLHNNNLIITMTFVSTGNVAPTAANLSHPGVCEPTDSADCLNKNGWDIDCSEGADFNCTGIDEPGT